jgi:hypothetical protein
METIPYNSNALSTQCRGGADSFLGPGRMHGAPWLVMASVLQLFRCPIRIYLITRPAEKINLGSITRRE